MRAHIAACALTLFQQEGYAAISMRRLAREAGCTAMTLYTYYDSKFDILSALWTDVFAQVFDALGQVAATQADPEARLRAMALGYVDYWLTHKEHYFLVFMSAGISQTDVTGYVSGSETLARFDALQDSLQAVLGGQVSAETLRLKTQLLSCMLHGIAHNLITIGGYPWSEPQKLVQLAIDGLLTTA